MTFHSSRLCRQSRWRITRRIRPQHPDEPTLLRPRGERPPLPRPGIARHIGGQDGGNVAGAFFMPLPLGLRRAVSLPRYALAVGPCCAVVDAGLFLGKPSGAAPGDQGGS